MTVDNRWPRAPEIPRTAVLVCRDASALRSAHPAGEAAGSYGNSQRLPPPLVRDEEAAIQGMEARRAIRVR
jgi:hypothetical protein